MWSDDEMPKDAAELLFDALSEHDEELEELDLADFDAPYAMPMR